MVHNGNFHPMVLAVTFDALRVGIAHVGQLSERRMSHLWDAFFEGLGKLEGPGGWGAGTAGPETTSRGEGTPPLSEPESFGVTLRYSGAALVAELKQLAAPATLDVPPLDIGVEDHATGAPLSVRKTREALGLLEGILAIELLLARDVLSLMPGPPSLGEGTGQAVRSIERALAEHVGADRSPAAIHRAVQDRVLGEVVAWIGETEGLVVEH